MSSRSCWVRTFCEILGISRRRAAKCFGDSANQYTIINFHFPPIAASAAVKGPPLTGLGRARRVWLPSGAFLFALIGHTIVLLDEVTGGKSHDDSRSPKLSGQAGSPRGIYQFFRKPRRARIARPWNENNRPFARSRK